MDLLTLQRDPAVFRQHLRIDVSGSPTPLGRVLQDWQAQDFTALDTAWQQMAGQKAKDRPKQRAYLERGRGASKTSDLAVMATWALFASRRPITGYAAAGDIMQRDRALLLRLKTALPYSGSSSAVLCGRNTSWAATYSSAYLRTEMAVGRSLRLKFVEFFHSPPSR